ncbi:MAG: exodeoxyribonuclease III [Clostridiales bacterium]|nr:exodeoxyribonuclease III [Clostridiales bacterium]
MKLISWNVNGLRSCMNKGFMDFFKAGGADFFCIQETKMQREQSAFEFDGYFQYWNSAVKKGYSGTAVFSKTEPVSVTYSMGNSLYEDVSGHDNEGRLVILEYEKFYLINIYTPNSKHELLRLSYRMDWEDNFRSYLKSLKKPVIICGDLNVAHTEIDIKNAKSNRKNAGFTDEEREKMTMLLSSGFTDTFRYKNPDARDAYTWWSFMGNARANNVGWRIDYFLVSDILRKSIINANIYPEIFGSDHCPVGLEIDI